MLWHPEQIACLLIVLAAPHHVLADDNAASDDPVAKIAVCLPGTWKVSLASRGHSAIIRIETDPMDTVSSLMSAEHRKEKAVVIIEFEVLPKYSPAMLKRIREHNAAISARLKEFPHGSAERRELVARAISYPLFQDAQYSYRVVAPDRVASRGEDIRLIERVLSKVCAGWKPIKKGGRVVGEIMDYYSPG